MKLLIRVVITAVALWLAAALVSGIDVHASDTGTKILTLLVVAVIVGVINGVLKPIIKTVGCAFYVLTLGLIALVVNGLLLWLASYISGVLDLPFHVDGFWVAVVLCDVEGLSYEEIGATLGVKLGTVRSRIHRGRQMLKAAMETRRKHAREGSE